MSRRRPVLLQPQPPAAGDRVEALLRFGEAELSEAQRRAAAGAVLATAAGGVHPRPGERVDEGDGRAEATGVVLDPTNPGAINPFTPRGAMPLDPNQVGPNPIPGIHAERGCVPRKLWNVLEAPWTEEDSYGNTLHLELVDGCKTLRKIVVSAGTPDNPNPVRGEFDFEGKSGAERVTKWHDDETGSYITYAGDRGGETITSLKIAVGELIALENRFKFSEDDVQKIKGLQKSMVNLSTQFSKIIAHILTLSKGRIASLRTYVDDIDTVLSMYHASMVADAKLSMVPEQSSASDGKSIYNWLTGGNDRVILTYELTDPLDPRGPSTWVERTGKVLDILDVGSLPSQRVKALRLVATVSTEVEDVQVVETRHDGSMYTYDLDIANNKLAESVAYDPAGNLLRRYDRSFAGLLPVEAIPLSLGRNFNFELPSLSDAAAWFYRQNVHRVSILSSFASAAVGLSTAEDAMESLMQTEVFGNLMPRWVPYEQRGAFPAFTDPSTLSEDRFPDAPADPPARPVPPPRPSPPPPLNEEGLKEQRRRREELRRAEEKQRELELEEQRLRRERVRLADEELRRLELEDGDAPRKRPTTGYGQVEKMPYRGLLYTGNVEDGVPSGFGILERTERTSDSEEVFEAYEGQWVAGESLGKGVYTYRSPTASTQLSGSFGKNFAPVSVSLAHSEDGDIAMRAEELSLRGEGAEERLVARGAFSVRTPSETIEAQQARAEFLPTQRVFGTPFPSAMASLVSFRAEATLTIQETGESIRGTLETFGPGDIRPSGRVRVAARDGSVTTREIRGYDNDGRPMLRDVPASRPAASRSSSPPRQTRKRQQNTRRPQGEQRGAASDRSQDLVSLMLALGGIAATLLIVASGPLLRQPPGTIWTGPIGQDWQAVREMAEQQREEASLTPSNNRARRRARSPARNPPAGP
jgi:hypothetical protein